VEALGAMGQLRALLELQSTHRAEDAVDTMRSVMVSRTAGGCCSSLP
jgi:hypothetical protein